MIIIFFLKINQIIKILVKKIQLFKIILNIMYTEMSDDLSHKKSYSFDCGLCYYTKIKIRRFVGNCEEHFQEGGRQCVTNEISTVTGPNCHSNYTSSIATETIVLEQFTVVNKSLSSHFIGGWAPSYEWHTDKNDLVFYLMIILDQNVNNGYVQIVYF